MFGKISLFLPMSGKMVPAHGERFCQCLANFKRFCQGLAKVENRAADAAHPPPFTFNSSLFPFHWRRPPCRAPPSRFAGRAGRVSPGFLR
jgi:hypothetical protein